MYIIDIIVLKRNMLLLFEYLNCILLDVVGVADSFSLAHFQTVDRIYVNHIYYCEAWLNLKLQLRI